MTFETSIERVLGHEAGYVNDPRDPGGETKWGISKRTYPHLDIANLTRSEAIGLYRRDFWEKIHADLLSHAGAYQVLDAAVHSGIEESLRFLQRALDVADDGDWGPVTREAFRQVCTTKLGESETLIRFNCERLEFMTRRKNWPVHGKGWARRIAQNLRYLVEDI